MSRPYQKGLIFLLIFSLVGWGAYRFLFKGKVEQIKKLRLEKELIEQEITQRSSQGDSLLKQDVRDVHRRLQADISVLSKALPFEAEVPVLFNRFLGTVREKTKVEYRFFQPAAFKDEGKYRRLPIKMVLWGPFSGLEDYLLALDKLPMITHVDKLLMKRVDSGVTGKSVKGTPFLPSLAMDLDLSVFVFPGGEENEGKKVLPSLLSSLRDPFYSNLFVQENLRSLQALSGFPATMEAVAADVDVDKKEREASQPPSPKKEVSFHYEGYWRGRQPKAFVNGDLVGLGEKVEEYKVVQIDEQQVVLEKGSEEKILYLERE